MTRASDSFCLAKSLRRDQLLLPRLEFDLRAQCINGGSQSGFLLVRRFVIKSLSIADLSHGRLNAGGAGYGQQVRVSHGKNYHFSRVFVAVLRGLQTLGGGAFLLNISEIEDGLTDCSARIEVVKGADYTRKRKRKKVTFKA